MKLCYPIFFLGVLALLASCGDSKPSEQSDEFHQVTEAMKGGIKTLANLDDIEKEINEYQEKLDNQTLKGFFKGSLDGKPLNYTSWSASSSRGTIFPHKMVLHCSLDPEKNISLHFVIQSWKGGDLFDGSVKKGLSGTDIPYKIMDKDFMAKVAIGHAKVSYSNGETDEKWMSADSEVVVERISSDRLRARWKGEALMGDWQEKNLVPFEAEVDLQFDFVDDRRNPQ